MASISFKTNQKQPANNKEERKRSSNDNVSNSNHSVLPSEEENVLASLGTTRAEASKYESNVLRQATHKLAPTLRLYKPSKSKQPTALLLLEQEEPAVGFPDLISTTSLLPFSAVQQRGSAAAVAAAGAYKAARTNNRQVILQVLQQLQSQIMIIHANNSTSNTNISVEQMRLLVMKEQMLLSMLGGSQQSKRQSTQDVWKQQETVTQGIYEQFERSSSSSNQRRRGRVSMMIHKQLHGNNTSNTSSVIPGSSSLAKATAQLRRSRKKKGAWQDWSSEEEDEDDSASNGVLAEMNSRRRQPKKQTPKQQKAALTKLRSSHQKRRASSASSRRRKAPTTRRRPVAASRTRRHGVGNEFTTGHLDEDFTSSRRPKRKRTVVASYADKDAYVEEEEEEDNVDVEGCCGDENDSRDDAMLATATDNTESAPVGTTMEARIKEENASTAIEDTDTAAADARPEEYSPTATNIDNSDKQIDETTAEAAATVAIKEEPPQQMAEVTCPLCQEMWTPSSPDTVDVELSQHIAQCQNGGGRRSSRRRATPATYADAEDEAGGDNDDAFETTSRFQQGSKRRRTSRSGNTDTTRNHPEFTFDDELDDEEDGSHISDDVEGEADDKYIFDNDVEEDDETLEADEYNEEGEAPLENPTAVDDFRLDDYEDRVDYWRLYGVGQMRDMSKLRAEGETDPGAVTYQGGLQIPAWMNNRLFAYQRTGLEWMWTLHQQQAGGVCGDEVCFVMILMAINNVSLFTYLYIPSSPSSFA